MNPTEQSRIPQTPQTRGLIPIWIWHALRGFVLIVYLGMIYLLQIQPELSLFIFWALLIPALPLLVFIAPMLWRNLCPLATANQMPRRLVWKRQKPLPRWLANHAEGIGIGLFFVLVTARKFWLDSDALALAWLLTGLLVLAFLGGVFFKGKSGWCASFCPLLSLERNYGQSPLAPINHSHCRPCVGCVENCYDLNPHAARLADLYDANLYANNYRRIFAGALPGFVLAFFTLPAYPALSIIALYLLTAAYCLLSLLSFYAMERLLGHSSHMAAALYGAGALTLFYWFSAPILAGALQQLTGQAVSSAFTLGLPGAILALSPVWLLKTHLNTKRFSALR